MDMARPSAPVRIAILVTAIAALIAVICCSHTRPAAGPRQAQQAQQVPQAKQAPDAAVVEPTSEKPPRAYFGATKAPSRIY